MIDPKKPQTIDEYIATFSPDVQAILEKIRSTLHEEAAGGGEKISYQMPTLTLEGGSLIYFAAFKKHIGLYPPVDGDEALMQALKPYLGEKGNLKFPLSEPIPYPLIRRVVRARVRAHRENLAARRGQR